MKGYQAINDPKLNERQRLGAVIKWLCEERQMPPRIVAKITGAPIGTVTDWAAGLAVPTSGQWAKLKRGVNRAFAQYSDLWRKALDEQDSEQALARKAMEHHHMASIDPKPAPTTKSPAPLKHQPLASIATIKLVKPPPAAPPPAPSPEPALEQTGPRDTTKLREALAKLPPGWKSNEAINRRKEFALKVLRERPGIRASGADSLDELLQRTFGMGISEAAIRELRAQVQQEQAERERERIRAEVTAEVTGKHPIPPVEMMPHEQAPTAPTARPVAAPAPTSSADPEENIRTAVSLILESIPELQTFTIAIDEHGEASVDYQIRKVKIETVGGSLKVRR